LDELDVSIFLINLDVLDDVDVVDVLDDVDDLDDLDNEFINSINNKLLDDDLSK